MVGRIIHTIEDVEEGAHWLRRTEPRFALALDKVGPLPLRRRPDGFKALLDAIVGQQVSIASAQAIWNRLETAGLTEPAALAHASDKACRAVGLSRQKARYARDLAQARLDYDALRIATDDEVVATLTSLPGIGTWTAEIYAMFALGRADVFAHGDLALQEAAMALFELPSRPKERQMREMAAAWTPWRSVAARLLWAYYRVLKERDGIR